MQFRQHLRARKDAVIKAICRGDTVASLQKKLAEEEAKGAACGGGAAIAQAKWLNGEEGREIPEERDMRI